MLGQLMLAVLLFGPTNGLSTDRAKTRWLSAVCGQHAAAESAKPGKNGGEQADGDQFQLYLRRATGSLKVQGRASCDTYQIYFHVPISFYEQAPVLLQVTCPEIIDYHFVREDPPNLLVAARMLNANSATLDWTSWVLVRQNTYPDLPAYVPIPAPGGLPDSVQQWLDTTDCCQVSAPIVQFKADSIRDTTTNLMKLAQDICDFCHDIPDTMPHAPGSCDAEYALKWGNFCTGHAHAAAALLRANGVPARVLLNMPVGHTVDMHWIVDYYVPGYGWVKMESAWGMNPLPPQDHLVVRACNAADEFPVWTPYGVESEWHSSDTTYDMYTPEWGLAHKAYSVLSVADSRERIDHAIALADSVYGFYTSYWGIGLSPAESAVFAAALSHQTMALSCLQSGELLGFTSAMQAALADYQTVNPAPIETLYSESFEDGPAGWTHGGGQDEWELGEPSYGPASAHSGRSCWGTNLDGPYANDEDCWLASPPIDLSSLVCADLSFWIWNSVQDVSNYVDDPVWVEVSADGASFRPLSSLMGGVTDDPEITSVGGWSHVFLDLCQYLGNTVQFRFRFRSDGDVVFAGSYVDDVQVVGRWIRPQSVVRGALHQPAAISQGQQAAFLLDISGRKVMTLQPGANDVRRLPAGVYFVLAPSIEGGKPTTAVRKVVVTR